MGKNLAEIKEEFSSLRTEMYASSESVDLKLVASYLDRLVISLEGLMDTLETMEASMDSMCSAPAPKPSKVKLPKSKKAKPKKSPSKKSKRR